VLTDAIKGTKRVEKVIPETCITLLNGLHNYFARSPSRKKEMREYINAENADYIEQQRRAKAERRRAPPGHVILNPVDQLANILGVLEERHKLPRRIVMTRWLSCGDAVRVALNSRRVYINFFSNENNELADRILELLEDSAVVAWYACLQDVIPVLTGMNILFQSNLPLPHLLHSEISSAKATLINMVGTAGAARTRTELLPIGEVDTNTSFGAYANNYLRDNRDGNAMHGTRLTAREILDLKKSWHKLFAHCVHQIDARFPPANMHYFKLMEVLDPNVVHGPHLRRHLIGTPDDISVVAGKLVHLFEVPLHGSGLDSPENIKNSFTLFKVSDICANVWKETITNYVGAGMRCKPFDHSLIYSYYRALMHIPDIKPWALFALFVLVFPTGNAISERGFSAMGATHSKQRHEMGHEQVFANLIIGFNGPSVPEFATQLDIESRQPNWPLYIQPTNLN
jgi:hypothetical protein